MAENGGRGKQKRYSEILTPVTFQITDHFTNSCLWWSWYWSFGIRRFFKQIQQSLQQSKMYTRVQESTYS